MKEQNNGYAPHSGGVAARLNELTLKNNIPVAVTIELTRRCPLACAHCYLPETRGRSRAAAGRELTTPQWKKILERLAEAGAVYLVFTGGEPLLRPDLAGLCAYAKKLNFDVRLYSSGLGLTRVLAAALKKAGVSSVELSVYGRPATHDRITGCKGSFLRTKAAAKLLKRTGITVKLKTPLMKSNFGEAAWLLRLAKELDCESALDPVLSPGNDGNRDNLRLRLDKKELAAVVELLEKNGPRAAYRASRTAPRASRLAPLAPSHASRAPSLDFFCGAGRNVAAVDPYGDLSPCLQLPVKLGNVLQTPLMILWKSSPWLKKWRALKTGDLKECRNCANLSICNRCPGVSLLEEGDVLVPNEPACEMAELKAKG